MNDHLLHVYTGDGKGKTTAAMGLALRMLGHGKPVLIAQFMKDGTSGELNSLGRFENAHIYEGARMQGFIWRMTPPQLEQARQAHREAADSLLNVIHALRPELTILDELCVALATRLLTLEDAFRLTDTALLYGDAVVTGRNAPEALLERADYVSRIEAVKHPFDQGQKAREGIEW